MDASSFTAITTTGRLNLTRDQGQPFSMAARICSNCHAILRAFFSPAFDTTVKLGLLVSTQVSADAGRGATTIASAIENTARRYRSMSSLLPETYRRTAAVYMRWSVPLMQFVV